MERGLNTLNLKKGLSFVAFGFFFTLINLNLTLNGAKLNVTPDFIGWILFFLAFDLLGTYVKDKLYLKWLSLVLVIITAADWVLEITKPELDTGAVRTFVTVLSGVYMYLLFGALEVIARDFKSSEESTIRILRILNIVLYLGFVAAALAGASSGASALLLLSAILGMAALIAAIITMVVLFRLKGEIGDKLDEKLDGKDVEFHDN